MVHILLFPHILNRFFSQRKSSHFWLFCPGVLWANEAFDAQKMAKPRFRYSEVPNSYLISNDRMLAVTAKHPRIISWQVSTQLDRRLSALIVSVVYNSSHEGKPFRDTVPLWGLTELVEFGKALGAIGTKRTRTIPSATDLCYRCPPFLVVYCLVGVCWSHLARELEQGSGSVGSRDWSRSYRFRFRGFRWGSIWGSRIERCQQSSLATCLSDRTCSFYPWRYIKAYQGSAWRMFSRQKRKSHQAATGCTSLC